MLTFLLWFAQNVLLFSGNLPTAATPTFSPSSGTPPQTVTISASSGSVICYNTSGSPATNGTTGCTTGTLYTGTVSVSTAETLYAVAGGTGYKDSTVGSATYSGTITFVSGSNAGACASTGNHLTVTTGTVNTTGANFLVIGCPTFAGSGLVTPNDAYSNLWTALTQYAGGTNGYVRLFYSGGTPTVGASETYTCSYASSNVYPAVLGAAFAGVATSSIHDQENGAGNNAASATTFQAGSITPTNSNELLIALMGYGNGTTANAATITINSGYTITNSVAPLTNGCNGGSMAYLIQTTATSENPTWSFTVAQPQNNISAANESFNQ